MKILNSPNFNRRPEGVVIDTIIIHYTVIDYDATIKKFQDSKSKVSAHYVIAKDGEVTNCVAEEKRAWHAGISYFRGMNNLNDNSIGIELENDGKSEFPKKQMDSLINLINIILKRHENIIHHNILGHSDIAPDRKQDPGIYFKWDYLFENGIGIYPDICFAQDFNKILLVRGDFGDEVMRMQQLLADFGYQITIDGNFDKQTEAVIRAFKTHYCRDKIDDKWDLYADEVLKKLISD